MRTRWWLLGLGVATGIGLWLTPPPPRDEKAEQAKLANEAIAEARRRMRYTSTPEQRDVFAKALRQVGWNCPAVKNIRWDDEDAKGKNAKVSCGPNDGTGNVYSDRMFQTTIRPNGKLEAKQVGLYD
jgi:hypothetical protein